MTFAEAIKAVQTYPWPDGAVEAIVLAVEPLCRTETDPDQGTTLLEWISSGTFEPGDTPQGLADEFDCNCEANVPEPCAVHGRNRWGQVSIAAPTWTRG